MFTFDTCLHAIRAQYPDLQIESAKPDTSGQYNHVLVVNGSLIFRFPRYEEGIHVLEREAAILDAVRAHLPLPVPHFTYRHLAGSAPGQAFVAYQRIPGALLWKETLISITEPQIIRRTALQLGGFLFALHNIPPERVSVKLPLKGERSEWERMYLEIRELLFPHMRPDAREWACRYFETYLEDASLQAFRPCLTHGDFGPSNVLYDDMSQRVCGVIDFGSAGLGDPAQDIAAASVFGEAFLEHYAEAYPGIETLLPRARFIRGTFALSEALHGAKSGDEEAFRSGMAEYV